MQSQHKLYHRKDNCAELAISSKTIYQDICNIGGTENKSLSIKMPSVPMQFIPSFLRGYFAGDGCRTYKKDTKCYMYYTCSGSTIFLQQVYDYLKTEGIITGSGVYFPKSSHVPKLIFNKSDGISFAKYIAPKQSQLYLKRKHD